MYSETIEFTPLTQCDPILTVQLNLIIENEITQLDAPLSQHHALLARLSTLSIPTILTHLQLDFTILHIAHFELSHLLPHSTQYNTAISISTISQLHLDITRGIRSQRVFQRLLHIHWILSLNLTPINRFGFEHLIQLIEYCIQVLIHNPITTVPDLEDRDLTTQLYKRFFGYILPHNSTPDPSVWIRVNCIHGYIFAARGRVWIHSDLIDECNKMKIGLHITPKLQLNLMYQSDIDRLRSVIKIEHDNNPQHCDLITPHIAYHSIASHFGRVLLVTCDNHDSKLPLIPETSILHQIAASIRIFPHRTQNHMYGFNIFRLADSIMVRQSIINSKKQNPITNKYIHHRLWVNTRQSVKLVLTKSATELFIQREVYCFVLSLPNEILVDVYDFKSDA
jgi:hypothetical protein